MEWIKVMMTSSLIRYFRRNVDLLWGMVEHGAGQLNGWKGSLADSYSLPPGPIPPAHSCTLHVPCKCCAVEWLCSCILVEGLWIGSFHLFKFIAPYCPGFLNSHPVVIFSPHNCLGALHPGLEIFPWVDNLGSFIGGSCFSFPLVQWCLEVLNCPLPFEFWRPLYWKHMIDS